MRALSGHSLILFQKQLFVRDGASCWCGPQSCCLVKLKHHHLWEAGQDFSRLGFLTGWPLSVYTSKPFTEKELIAAEVSFFHRTVSAPTQCLAEEMPCCRRCISLRGQSMKSHRLGNLKNTRLFAHSSGGWKSEIKMSAGLVFYWGHFPWFANSHLLPVSSQGLPSVHTCVLISSCKDTSHIGLGPTHTT